MLIPETLSFMEVLNSDTPLIYIERKDSPQSVFSLILM